MSLPEEVKSNLIVIAPTGSGKTTSFIRNLPAYLKQFDHVFMLFPTKALTHQISLLLRSLSYDFLRDDSDARLDEQISVKDWYSSKIIVTSYEKADSVLLLHPDLANNSLILIDEVHLATTERAISILSILANCKDKARIIAMSATIPNAKDLADYLQAEIIRHEQQKNVQIYEHNLGSKPEYARDYNDLVAAEILRIIEADPKVPTIVFRASRKQCEELSAIITNNTKAKAMPYHAGLDRKFREKVSSMFINREIDCIVATSSLAYGVNTPAERVIIGGLSVYTFDGWKTINSVDVTQMAGRAGRPGYSNRAEIHVIYFDEEEPILRAALSENYCEEIGLKEDMLDTVLLRMILSKRVKTTAELEKISKEWFNVPPIAKFYDAVNILQDDGLVAVDSTGRIELTKIGHLVAKHYITVPTYRVVKDLIFNPATSRKEKLDRIASSVYNLRRSSYRVDEDSVPNYLYDIAQTPESFTILAQLTTVTGDTENIAETIKKLGFFLKEATNDEDWKILSETMILLRKIARNENANISGILKSYVDETIDHILELQKQARKASKIKSRKRKDRF